MCANKRFPVYLLFSLKILCSDDSSRAESGLKKQELSHSGILGNFLGGRVGKTRGHFGVNPHKRCPHCYFFRNMADEQMGTKCTLYSIINFICTIYYHITVSMANETQITHINDRLWLASILLQGNRVVYKHSHQNGYFFPQSFCIVFCAFINIFISNVHCFCPSYNSFVVMDWEIAMIHIWLCVANWWRLKKGGILQWLSWANAVFIRWGIFWWKAGTCAYWDRQEIIQLVYTRYGISIWEVYDVIFSPRFQSWLGLLPTISHHYA